MRFVPAAFLLVLATTALVWGGPASAHFSAGAKIRTVVVASEGGVTVAYVRTPAPLLFGDVVTEAIATERALDTPFLELERTGTGLRYRLSLEAVERGADAWLGRLSGALAWSWDGRPIEARLLRQRIVGRAPQDRFATPEDARASLGRESARLDPVFGDAIVELAFALDDAPALGALQLRSALPDLPLPAGVSIDNHIVDARTAPSVAYTRPGQLSEGVTIDGALWRATLEFAWQGVVHILEGLDHVLLVVCLALGVGAATLRLLWMVTAFTIGHSVTLVAAFLGMTPSWPWFVPAVEAAIAATVLYAAVAAWFRRMDAIWVVAGIGLLHGFGFSFVLGEILGRDAPHLIPALAAFNIGIEVGQIAIVAATLAVFLGLSRLSASVAAPARAATLAIIALISAYWVMDRSLAMV